MDNRDTTATAEKPAFRDKHSFLVFIILSIFITSVVVMISMTMYNGSGAAQLDLSRPGYVSVRSQAMTNEDGLKIFLSTGEINKSVINDFKSLFNKQAQKVKAVDAFGGDPLSPDALGISAPSGQ